MNSLRTFTSIAMVLAAGTLCAQDTTGTIAGRVTDKAGKPIADVRVRLSSPSMLGDRITRTDANGQYRIPLLPNGAYSVSSDAAGYLGAKGSFHILAGQTSHFDFTLRTMKEIETTQSAVVEVVGSVAQVDKTDTVTQSNFSVETLNSLGNNDTASLLLMLGSMTPGISSSDLSSQSGINIRGGSGHATKTLINGVTLTEEGGGYLLETGTIADMLDSMAVIQSPLNAKYGNTDGGIVSMVTTKGSNTFQGSVRLNVSRPDWNANNVSYPNRLGVSPANNFATDQISRKYEYTIKGPLWKDHITFAYGGILVPNLNYSAPFDTLQNNPTQPTDPNGIFYRDLARGNVIRKANLWASGQNTTDVQSETYNQFVVFMQITPNHSLEWNYTQDDQDYTSAYNVINGDMRGDDAYKLRTWDLGYKGIIGTRGVLEARFARTSRAFPHPYSPDSPPIYVNTYPTGTPDANGSYLANSLVQGYDQGFMRENTNGFYTDRGDTFKAESFMLNYQHMLEMAGNHMIDVGMEQETFRWNTQAAAAKYTYYSPGQISPNLTAGDILGAGGVDPSAYAGKYIVFNSAALLSNLDPGADAVPIIGSGYDDLIPSVKVLSGSEDGSYQMVTDSYYVNDLWTVNQNHSFMAGVRYDRLKVHDSVKTIASYGIPTVRFEYKWDIFGDQSRVLNASFAQFHSRQPGSLFYPMVTGRLANSTTYYWNQGTSTPYLVDKSALLNLANYGYTASQSFAGQSFVADPNWKAPVSNEISVGLRRTYKNGGFLRTTAVYRWWNNLFDFFPGESFTAANGSKAFHTVLRNDPGASRTYKSVEVEWMVPFTPKLTFGGNYTFSRLVSNVRNMLDNPSRSSSQTSNSTNFRDWYLNYMTRDQFNPETLRNPEHVIKWYASYNLSRGKVKSNIALRGSYTSGVPMTRTSTYTIPYETIPGYNDATNKNTGGLINTLAESYGAGQFTNQDLWDANLQYNVEFPVVRTLVWFINVQVNNFLNIRTPAQYVLPAQATATRDAIGQSTKSPYGFQLGQDLSAVGTRNTSAANGTSDVTYYRNGLRTISLQTGLRF